MRQATDVVTFTAPGIKAFGYCGKLVVFEALLIRQLNIHSRTARFSFLPIRHHDNATLTHSSGVHRPFQRAKYVHKWSYNTSLPLGSVRLCCLTEGQNANVLQPESSNTRLEYDIVKHTTRREEPLLPARLHETHQHSTAQPVLLDQRTAGDTYS